jgi:hypothetical protein
MINENNKAEISQFIRNLCPGATEAELQEAEQNFMEYLMVVKRIAYRIEAEGLEVIDFDG